MQNQLDPSIVAMTKAIGQSESGGNYTVKGKSGEYGAYQYTKPTWEADSKKYLGNSVPLEQATPAQQDEVAYKKIKDLGSQGYKPDQIASIWNSGKPDYEGNIGTNKYGVHFDTPAYVKSVGANYEKIMSGGNATADPSNPSYVPGGEPSKNEDGFITSANLPVKKEPPEATDLSATTQANPSDTSGKVISVLGDVSGTKKLGEGAGYALSNAMGTQDDYIKANQQLIDTQSKLIEAIHTARAKGRDTSRLEQALQELSQHIKLGGEQATDVGTGGISNGQVLGSAVQTATTALTLPSLIKGGASLLGGSKVLSSPAVESAMSRFNMPMAEFQSLSAGEKLNALTEALKTSSPAGKLVLQQAIEEVAPTAIKEAGGKVAFAKLYPKLAKTGGLIGTILKGIGGMAVSTAGVAEANSLYHKLVK